MEAFDEMLATLTRRFIAALAIGLLVQLGMLVLDRPGTDVDILDRCPCNLAWLANRFGTSELGTHKSVCSVARDD